MTPETLEILRIRDQIIHQINDESVHFRFVAKNFKHYLNMFEEINKRPAERLKVNKALFEMLEQKAFKDGVSEDEFMNIFERLSIKTYNQAEELFCLLILGGNIDEF